MKVVVVGAGIIGTSVAYNLAKGGVSVTLLDATDPASGTTSRSFAWVNANNKTPKTYFDLNVSGMQENAALQRELGGEWLYTTGNTIVSEDAGSLEKKVLRLKGWGYKARIISPEEAREVEPGSALSEAFPNAAVAHFSGESWADAPLATRTITDAARSIGAEVRTGAEVVGTEAGKSVALGGGEILAADAIVNAAGPDGAKVARMVGRGLPLDVFPGLIARVSAPPEVLNGLLHTPLVNLRPDGDGYLAIHHETIDERISEEADLDALAEELLKRARKIVPALEGSEVVGLRPGLRPVPGDGYSCVGGLPDLPGYYEALTHSGVTLGPLVGRLLAAEVLTGAPDPLLAPFRPDRF
ncbi:NAD(P)/FAD-dependent oxidoreductase [Rubrobacter indicoceani]|uniref:NAD(P)/FAD-dependent oxidoreductase n=1 Tax=Rubrobacter indicoceani TaxID=2051957 RepID=UPI000E5AAA2F|nr:FAD-dependent oxidoreductase [Rubrobacter indicoceani]